MLSGTEVLFSSAKNVLRSIWDPMYAVLSFATDPSSRTPNIDSDSLIKKINESPDRVVAHDFGKTLGTVYFIKADEEHDDLDALVEAIHKKQPNPQRSRSHLAWLSGGPLLSARSGPDAIRHHRLFISSLSRADDYIRFALDELQKNMHSQKASFNQLISPSIYNVLTRGLFGLDELPKTLEVTFSKFSRILEGSAEAQQPKTDAMSDFASNNHTLLKAMHFTSLLSLNKSFSDLRDHYQQSAAEFIASQFNHVKADLGLFSQNQKVTNIISLSVIEVIKERNPHFFEDRIALNHYLEKVVEDEVALKEILTDRYLHTIPASLFAGRTLQWVLASIIHGLGKDPKLLSDLRDNLSKYHLASDLSNIREVIEADKRANTLLHNMYMEGLRVRGMDEPLAEKQFSTLFRYYIAEPFEFNGIKIPGNSMVCILNGMSMYSEKIWGEKPETFNPARFFGPKEQLGSKARIPYQVFSRSPRVCPGNVVAEYIAKTMVCYLAMNFDLKLAESNKQITQLRDLKIELSKREIEGKEIKELRL